jgi:hypothetical protein
LLDLRVVKNEFPRIAVQMPIVAERVGAKHAHLIAVGAAERSRVLTGAMRAAWGSHALEISNAIHYVGFNERGTYKMSAQPMLHPAMEAEADPFFVELAAELWR